MRAFVALRFPEEFVDDVAELARSLEGSFKGRFLPRQNYHLTLAFLGEIDEVQSRQVMDALDRACAGFGPLDLSCEGLGSFGRRGDSTLWLGLGGNPALLDLAARLREELDACGIEYDGKPFKPHVTLARRAKASRDELATLPFPAGCVATDVVLFKSILDRSGATYKPLYTVTLGE